MFPRTATPAYASPIFAAPPIIVVRREKTTCSSAASLFRSVGQAPRDPPIPVAELAGHLKGDRPTVFRLGAFAYRRRPRAKQAVIPHNMSINVLGSGTFGGAARMN